MASALHPAHCSTTGVLHLTRRSNRECPHLVSPHPRARLPELPLHSVQPCRDSLLPDGVATYGSSAWLAHALQLTRYSTLDCVLRYDVISTRPVGSSSTSSLRWLPQYLKPAWVASPILRTSFAMLNGRLTCLLPPWLRPHIRWFDLGRGFNF